jgi:hypothetical protein
MKTNHRSIEAKPMRTKNVFSFVRKGLNDQGGQVLPWVTMMLFALLGMAGVTIDVGQAYVAKTQLQASSNAAAMSSAEMVYNTGTNDNASYWASQYSSQSASTGVSAGQNYNARLGAVTPNITTPCLNFLTSAKSGCTNNAAGNAVSPSKPNAVRVKQSATIPTTFMRIFGINTLTVSATATASFGAAKPWNVAIIVDATPSMGATDAACNNVTAEECALEGVQRLLGGGGIGAGIPPCKDTTVGCSAYTSTALFRVTLFSFPNVTTATVANDYQSGCTSTSTKPTVAPYTFPVVPVKGSTTGYTPITYTGTTSETATYQILQHSADTTNIDANGFTTDYYNPSATDFLNTSSVLVRAIGHKGTKGCLKQASGWNQTNQTYFAGAIYAAQAALNAEKAAADALLGIETSNAIIFVGDGQANAPHTSASGGEVRFPYKTSTASAGGISVTSDGTSTTNLAGAASSFGKYPDFNDNCQQAIQAAEDVKNLGTRFYAVAYGAEPGGCLTTPTYNPVTKQNEYGTDSATALVPINTTYGGVTTPLNVGISSTTQIVPCLVLQDMASPADNANSPWYFYSDGASGCTDSQHSTSSLSDIFGVIQSTFVKPRLLPNNIS